LISANRYLLNSCGIIVLLIQGGCGYEAGRRADYVARSQDMLAAGRVAAANSALAAHGVDLSDTASLQLALHGAGIHGLHALDDVAQVTLDVLSISIDCRALAIDVTLCCTLQSLQLQIFSVCLFVRSIYSSTDTPI